MSSEQKTGLIEKRREKLEDLRQQNVTLFPNDVVVSHTVAEILGLLAAKPADMTENAPVFTVAGRMMAINRFGKAAFIRFADRTGQLQAYVRTDQSGGRRLCAFQAA